VGVRDDSAGVARDLRAGDHGRRGALTQAAAAGRAPLTRIHVTGATGYLGGALLRLRPDATGERVDVRDAGAVRSTLARLRPDVVIHTAYRQDGPDAHEITVAGAEHVARAARAAGARLVHLSTDVVFDGRKGAPYVEDDPPSPVTRYGRDKAEAEERVLAAHPDALVVRTSLIYGGPGAPASKHELAARDPGATFYEDEIRCPVQVGDLAAALLELAAAGLAGPLHVAGPDALSRAELAELVTGAPVDRAPAPPGRPLDCTLDSSRARSLLATELRGARAVLGA
jgi:dTDP-4-dehydrorhamnose reductase